MGIDMTAFIEYDKEQYYEISTPTGKIVPAQFTTDVYSVTMGEGLYTGSKDYLFFSAIAGVRNKSGMEPLYESRGLPSILSVPVSMGVRNGVFDGLYSVGWLLLKEINAALDHMSINRDHLGFETHTILGIMTALEERLGIDRVRLIFGFQ